MRRLILGGSFNPIHNGHLICARAVAEARQYHRITLIPSANPPHKAVSATLADSAHRLAMTRAAVADDALFEVDALELSRAGPSYTFDTAAELIARGEGPIDWLIGADMLMYLPKWHRPLELMQTVNFLIMARPGWSLEWDALPLEYQHLKDHVIEAPLIDISATTIRHRVSQGQSIRYLTPDPVCEYVGEKKLYLAEDGEISRRGAKAQSEERNSKNR